MEDMPEACPSCDSTNYREAEDKDEVFCENCGLVLSDDEEWSAFSTGDQVSESKHTETKDSKDIKSRLETPDEDAKLAWWEKSEPAIIGLVEEPSRTYQEYYKIENPDEFFEGCESDRQRLERIQKSDIMPFQKLDLDHVDWYFQI